MSYDFDIGDESLNYTSNGSAIFYDHMPPTAVPFAGVTRGGLHNLNGLTGSQAAQVIADTFDRIDRTRLELWTHDVGEPAFCAKYDSTNGWGSTVGALLFLARIQAACVRNPRKRVRLSA